MISLFGVRSQHCLMFQTSHHQSHRSIGLSKKSQSRQFLPKPAQAFQLNTRTVLKYVLSKSRILHCTYILILPALTEMVLYKYVSIYFIELPENTQWEHHYMKNQRIYVHSQNNHNKQCNSRHPRVKMTTSIGIMIATGIAHFYSIQSLIISKFV